MITTLNYNILVAEEQGIVNHEIKLRLKKCGYGIIERAFGDDLLKTIKTRKPDFTISCIGLIKKLKPDASLSKLFGETDTIIFDHEMKPLASYPKPFDSSEIISFMNKYLNKN